MEYVRSLRFSAICIVFLMIQSSATAFYSTPDINLPYPKAISDLKEGIVKGLGFQAEEFKISGFDVRDALVGQSVAYEFDVEIDNKLLPFKLLEDVNRWELVDLPILRVENSIRSGEEKNGLVARGKLGGAADGLPVLAPFQLAGPMELWIQDAKDMRLSLPHDVDAGVLKKVILADGAVLTVTGARSVSLRHPIELPLPLNETQKGFASGLISLAEHIREGARAEDPQLVSLRIVGPTSLTSPASSSSSSSTNKLKLKRLAPGLVELSALSKTKASDPVPAVDLRGEAKASTLLWPFASINGSNSNLLGFEKLLSSVLGPKAKEEGSFKLTKADVSAQTYVKIGFGVEKKLKEGDGNLKGIPAWRTKPEYARMQFEVLAKVEGDKFVAERVMEVNPVIVEDTVAPNVLNGNITMSKVPIVHPPPNYFTL